MTGLGLWRLPEAQAGWIPLSVEKEHGRGHCNSFESRGVDTERRGACHALYLAVTRVGGSFRSVDCGGSLRLRPRHPPIESSLRARLSEGAVFTWRLATSLTCRSSPWLRPILG